MEPRAGGGVNLIIIAIKIMPGKKGTLSCMTGAVPSGSHELARGTGQGVRTEKNSLGGLN